MRTLSNERGMAVEYVILAVLVALGAIFTIYRYGGSVRGRFDTAGSAVQGNTVDDGSSSGSSPSGQDSSGGGGGDGSQQDTSNQVASGTGGASSEGIAVGNFQISWSTAIWLGILLVVIGFLIVMQMARGAKEASKHGKKELAISQKTKRQSGQAMLEYFIAFLVGIMLILGTIQVALMFNAKTMVKLAAFNAARAAIVARDTSDATKAVDIDQMKDIAHTAAFVTLIPVVPSMHGFLFNTLFGENSDGSNAPGVDSFVNFVQGIFDNPGAVIGLIFENVGKTINDDFPPGLEDPIQIKFTKLEPNDDGEFEEIENWELLEFDDPSKAADNRVRIEVTWWYPLVIPFVNRIFIATARPNLYKAALVGSALANGGDPIAEGLKNANDIQPWAVGSSLDKLTSAPGVILPPDLGPTVKSILQYVLYRVPIRDSYVMRMQWDRQPKPE